MKFGFSTLGCPGWLWPEVIAAAGDLGYDGVELRGLGAEMYLPHSKTFDPAHIPHVLEDLNKLRLEVPCLTTGAYLFDPAHKDQAAREILDYLDLAALLKVPYIRILGDKNPEPGAADPALVEAHIRALLPVAAQKQVTLLLETNGIYADSQRLRQLMESIDDPHLGVLWDAHHPYRFYHEPVAETYDALKPWIKHVHIKDSVFEQGQTAYRMFGQGDIPVQEVLRLLQSRQYPGYVVLEWVKRWCKDLEEPGIVFAHFLNAAKNML